MGASFARSDSQKKQHKERSQPFNRQRYGLLEKKKDYVLRSADYKSKQLRLKTLRAKASNKNEDEFYFGMVHGTTKKGVAVKDRGNEALSQDVTKILKTQDAGYLRTVAAVERSKLRELIESRHVHDRDSAAEQQDDDEDDDEGEEEKGKGKGKKTGGVKRRRHDVFVETQEELQSLDPVTRLHTTPRHLLHPSNRLPPSPSTTPSSTTPLDPKTHSAATRERKKHASANAAREKERESRSARVHQMCVAERAVAVHRALQGSGARRKVGVDGDGVARYKWKQERKR